MFMVYSTTKSLSHLEQSVIVVYCFVSVLFMK